MPVDKMPVKTVHADEIPAGFGARWRKCQSLKILLISSISMDTWAWPSFNVEVHRSFET